VNREWVLFHLGEAQDEITKTIAEIQTTPDYDSGEFWVAMQHLYHHCNTAWNSRDMTKAQVDKATDGGLQQMESVSVRPSDDGGLGQLPNMRLKLAGLSLLKESECCALPGTNYRSTTRRAAGSPPAA